MDRKLYPFTYEGQMTDDANIVQLRENLISMAIEEMRTKGYVPTLDTNPLFTLSWEPEHNRYNFRIVIYGIFVGRKKAWEIEGFSDGKLLPKPTPRTK